MMNHRLLLKHKKVDNPWKYILVFNTAQIEVCFPYKIQMVKLLSVN